MSFFAKEERVLLVVVVVVVVVIWGGSSLISPFTQRVGFPFTIKQPCFNVCKGIFLTKGAL